MCVARILLNVSLIFEEYDISTIFLKNIMQHSKYLKVQNYRTLSEIVDNCLNIVIINFVVF